MWPSQLPRTSLLLTCTWGLGESLEETPPPPQASMPLQNWVTGFIAMFLTRGA